MIQPTFVRHCPGCRGQRVFEQPPCEDGHGIDCPEWSCVDCGHAIVADFDLEVEADETVQQAA